VLCIAVSTMSCRSTRRASEDQTAARVRVRSLLLAARARSRVGSRGAARSAGVALGVVATARISPDARWIAVVDRATPHVKVIDSAGTVRALGFARDSSRGVTPVLAVSNSRLLVMWPDSDEAGLYDLRGEFIARVPALGFAPLSATAISDSVWLVYGPSDARPKGRATWMHCLHVSTSRSTWTAGFVDSLRGPIESYWRAQPTMSDGTATIEHLIDQDHSVRLSTNCASEASGLAVTTTPVHGHDHTWVRLASELEAAKVSGDDAGATAFLAVSTAGPERDPMRGLYRKPALGRTIFEAGRSPAVAVPGRFRLLDARTGAGMLFATVDPTPTLFVVDPSALIQAVAFTHE
jgi:hypothetical protein